MLKAANLTAKDPNGKSDPYCRIFLGGTDHILHKTEIKSGTLNPVWKEAFTLFEGELAPFLHTQGKVECVCVCVCVYQSLEAKLGSIV